MIYESSKKCEFCKGCKNSSICDCAFNGESFLSPESFMTLLSFMNEFGLVISDPKDDCFLRTNLDAIDYQVISSTSRFNELSVEVPSFRIPLVWLTKNLFD